MGNRNTPAEPRSEISPFYTRLKLLWAAENSSLYRNLSNNILREICCYINIGNVKKLVAVLEDQVKSFDVVTSQWQQLLVLRKRIKVDVSTSSIFIPSNCIFVCGGGGPLDASCTCNVGSTAYLLEADGNVQNLPHMSNGRSYPGLCWDSTRQALYVFGGIDKSTYYTDSLRTNERFLSNEWSPLPKMHYGRNNFNPCWHLYLVYLCSGGGSTVETYDPRSNTFALQDFTLPEVYTSATAVSESGVLTVICDQYISKLQEGRFTSSEQHKCCYYPWSNCTPLITGGVVYILNLASKCCVGVDLASGAKVKEIRFS